MIKKLHLEEFTNIPGDADESRIRSVYHLDKHAYELYKLAKDNTNIVHEDNPTKAEIGYKAYWDLEQYIKFNNMDDSVLYDLAAAFAWDRRLEDACKRYDQRYGVKNYIKFHNIMLDPEAHYMNIENDLCPLIQNANKTKIFKIIQELEDTFSDYPNVLRVCQMWKERFLG